MQALMAALTAHRNALLNGAEMARDAQSWQDFLPEQAETWESTLDQASEQGFQGVADALGLIYEQAIQAAEAFDQPEQQAWATRQLATSLELLALVLEGESLAVDSVLEILSEERWPEPLSLEDLEFLIEILHQDIYRIRNALAEEELIWNDDYDGRLEKSEDSAKDTPDFCVVVLSDLDDENVTVDQNVLGMLSQSIRELATQPVGDNDYPYLNWVKGIAPVLRAVDSVHLYGAKRLLEGLLANIRLIPSSDNTWPIQALITMAAYLDALSVGEADESLNETLLMLFGNPELPVVMTDQQRDYIRQLMTIASVRSAAELEPEVVSEEHLVMPALGEVEGGLQGMLAEELPSLADALLASLQRADREQSIPSLVDAQRHAHTLKGLGNMAGLSALANLTHRMEDVLEMLCDDQVLPGTSLKNALMDSADALAQLIDAFLDDMVDAELVRTALQSMMDWYYRLKADGVAEGATLYVAPHVTPLTAAEGDAPATPEPVMASTPVAEPAETPESSPEPAPVPAAPAKARPAPAEESAAKTEPFANTAAAESSEEAQFRVSRTLVDDLFRLAGENTAMSSQFSDEITDLRSLTRISRDRHRQLQKLLLELEQHLNDYYTLQQTQSGDSDSNLDPLEMDRYHEVHTSFSMLNETAADVREVDHQMAERVQKLNDLQIAQAGLQRETLDSVVRARQVSVNTLVPRFGRILRQACRAAGKQAELVVEGGDTLIDSQILNQLTAPLMHMIRNAVDHGIETPHLRFEAEKPETGTITLRFGQEQDRIMVECEDDGDGLDLKRIRLIAIQRGLITEDQELTEHELQQLILLPGFSTREDTSQLSGRGIGMDVVAQEIRRLQGQILLNSDRGFGTIIELSLPSSTLIIRALLVRTQNRVFALASNGMGQTILSLDGELKANGDQLVFHHGQHAYDAYPLESLLGEPAVDYRTRSLFQVLLVETGQGNPIAVLVNEVIALRELVFKRMGPYVSEIPGIPGMTLLSNGSLAPVVDLPQRVAHMMGQHVDWLAGLEEQPRVRLPNILVVDDSLSARKSMATLLKDAGFEVATAIDGVEAMKQVEKQAPDLVVTDLEMPRMNGTELTSALRSNKSTASVPVIMMTSRSTQKHRAEAAAVGVSVYMTKPWSEHDVLDHIEQLLSSVPQSTTALVV